MSGRAAAVAFAGLILLGALGTFEVWQALTSDVIGLRAGGVARADQPLLFWVAFAVSAIVAAPMWIAALFLALVLALQLFSSKAK